MAERIDPKVLASQLSSERTSKSEDDTAGLSWERFSQWVCCVCVVTFDLELGQAMEVLRQLQLSLSLSLSPSLSLSLCPPPLFPPFLHVSISLKHRLGYIKSMTEACTTYMYKLFTITAYTPFLNSAVHHSQQLHAVGCRED